MSKTSDYNFESYDSKNPSMWTALWLENSLALDPRAKRAQLDDLRSFSRSYLFPIIKIYSFIMKVLFFVIKTLIPFDFGFPKLLHFIISRGLHYFVSPSANYLILRHFHLGSDVLGFLSQNLNCSDFPKESLYPKSVLELYPNQVLQHDVNLYNFVTYFNQFGKFPSETFLAEGGAFSYEAVNTVALEVSDMPNGILNVLDLESAIEMITPYFQLLIKKDEFWRASVSLQLDETIALYMSRLFNDSSYMYLVKNANPLYPNSTLQVGQRLVLHGLTTEYAHAFLIERKQESLS